MNKEPILINGNDLTLEQIYDASFFSRVVSLCPKALKKMNTAKEYVFDIVEKGKPVYGINTGFGALANKHIPKSDLAQLQLNLIRSHCTGVGQPFDKTTTRAIMLLRANCLASGYSGVNPELVQLLIEFLNHDVLPIVPSKGSVGASGDLAPLSHIALSLIGEGEVLYKNQKMNSAEVIQAIGKKACALGPKDGLGLINGTAVMAAIGALSCIKARNMAKLSDIAACATNEATRGSLNAYDPDISALKPHYTQIGCTNNLNLILNQDSQIRESHRDCDRVQDPYSLRCVPQVHGACRLPIHHCWEVMKTEVNSVTDNPLVFPDKDKVVSGGNFHGEALALSMDYMTMGIAELCNISERRIEKMMNPTFSDLPHFLTKNSGLNSGLMIAHVTAAALASENKYLSHPASVDSIPTSTDKEDHVSMGVTSGRKLNEVLENLQSCLAIEFLCNTQALYLLRPLKSTPAIEALYNKVREVVPSIEEDRYFAKDIENLTKIIEDGTLLESVETITGELK